MQGGPARLLAGPLYSRILWFYKYPWAQADEDNLPKRIHDALKDVLFADDHSISDSLAVRVDASVDYEIVDDPANPDAVAELREALEQAEHQDVLYIEIGPVRGTRHHLGPIA